MKKSVSQCQADDEHEAADAYESVLSVALEGWVRGAVDSGAGTESGTSFSAEVI